MVAGVPAVNAQFDPPTPGTNDDPEICFGIIGGLVCKVVHGQRVNVILSALNHRANYPEFPDS
jgi:hypothetical protein